VRRRALLLFAALVVASFSSSRGEAYQRTSNVDVGGRLFVRWNRLPIRYSITESGVSGVTAAQFRAAVERAANSWEQLPNSAIAFQLDGPTSALPLTEDGRNTIGFLDRPDLGGVLGAAVIIFDVFTGEIVESDAFLNSTFSWSVAENGEAGRFDVESVLMHEIGHMTGLAHSGLGEMRSGELVAAEAVMFPYFTVNTVISRRLKADDIAGIAEIYPDGGHREDTGSIVGRVRREQRGAFGAHVLAFNASTGAMVAAFALENGEFAISGLTRGPHIIRVEPIDDGTVADFLEQPPIVDVGFRTMFFQRLVTVERSATAPRLDIVVESK
jgi:hypothetical protein